MLKNTTYSMREIARYFHKDKETIRKINNGHQQIVRTLYKEDFPIRKSTRKGYKLKPVETIQG